MDTTVTDRRQIPAIERHCRVVNTVYVGILFNELLKRVATARRLQE